MVIIAPIQVICYLVLMTESYLNGKVEFSSMSAPTDADMEKWRALSQAEKQAVLVERGERSHASGISSLTLDDILLSAFDEAEKIKAQQEEHAI